jgi:hypothetical protein
MGVCYMSYVVSCSWHFIDSVFVLKDARIAFFCIALSSLFMCETISLNCGHEQACFSSPGDRWAWSPWEMIHGKACSSITLSTTNPTWTDRTRTSVSCGERPNRQSHSTAHNWSWCVFTFAAKRNAFSCLIADWVTNDHVGARKMLLAIQYQRCFSLFVSA